MLSLNYNLNFACFNVESLWHLETVWPICVRLVYSAINDSCRDRAWKLRWKKSSFTNSGTIWWILMTVFLVLVLQQESLLKPLLSLWKLFEPTFLTTDADCFRLVLGGVLCVLEGSVLSLKCTEFVTYFPPFHPTLF